VAVVCDYCTEPITEAAPFGIVVSVPQPGDAPPVPMRLDLHQECIGPFADEALQIKGDRPSAT
jgi:hypothetical protein